MLTFALIGFWLRQRSLSWPAGAEMLVPLTGSLFVPGRLASADEVLVDIGTGYYVSKPLEGARDFLEKKVCNSMLLWCVALGFVVTCAVVWGPQVEYVKNNLDALMKVIAGKRDNLHKVTQMIQRRVSESVGK